ncbi:MAG: alpha/beta fold hydrolase [Pantoea sp.]|uniref:alpha/beta hydrolase family protein n=1 Tax=Pantoea sp. TaxID=69393 RepID=UPI0039E491F7
MNIQSLGFPMTSHDGHRWVLAAAVPAKVDAVLLWLPALGVAAKHYQPFATKLAERGVAVFMHEWRGNGSSSLRPSRDIDWGYRQILELDLPQSFDAAARKFRGLPLIIGGHSLGGQLASLFAAQYPTAFSQLWLVASGTPDWRSFPMPLRWLLPFAYRLLPLLAKRKGYLDGHRIGFGGIEARGLISDWARVGRTGRYAAKGMDFDFEAALRQLAIPAHTVAFTDDWLAPRSSMAALLAKLAPAQRKSIILNARQLGTAANHFAWMKQPDSVVDCLLE